MHDLFDLLGDATQPLLDARNVRYLMEWHTRLPLHALSHMTRNRRRNGFYLISTFLLSSFVHEQIKNREIWNKSSRDWFNKNDPGAVAVNECLSGSQSASIVIPIILDKPYSLISLFTVASRLHSTDFCVVEKPIAIGRNTLFWTVWPVIYAIFIIISSYLI